MKRVGVTRGILCWSGLGSYQGTTVYHASRCRQAVRRRSLTSAGPTVRDSDTDRHQLRQALGVVGCDG